MDVADMKHRLVSPALRTFLGFGPHHLCRGSNGSRQDEASDACSFSEA
jgi:hypothetical protein